MDRWTGMLGRCSQARLRLLMPAYPIATTTLLRTGPLLTRSSQLWSCAKTTRKRADALLFTRFLNITRQPHSWHRMGSTITRYRCQICQTRIASWRTTAPTFWADIILLAAVCSAWECSEILSVFTVSCAISQLARLTAARVGYWLVRDDCEAGDVRSAVLH